MAPAAPDPSSNARKYATANPLVRGLIGRFLDRVAREVRDLAPARVLDLGCGEGFVAARLAALSPAPAYLGVDRSAIALAAARARCPGLRFEEADLLALALPDDGADLALCLEVLEHQSVAAGEALVARIARWAPRALISVPWEPWFRLGTLARGRYLARLGLHPEHEQRFSPRSLRRLLAPAFAEVEVVRVFPWLLARCARAAPERARA